MEDAANRRPGSDLAVTWTKDDAVFTAWGDGGGFGGTDKEGRVAAGFARIEGILTISPWTTIAYEAHWGRMSSDSEGLTCSFPAKWMSADGLTLWCVFSGYGGSAKEGINANTIR